MFRLSLFRRSFVFFVLLLSFYSSSINIFPCRQMFPLGCDFRMKNSGEMTPFILYTDYNILRWNLHNTTLKQIFNNNINYYIDVYYNA